MTLTTQPHIQIPARLTISVPVPYSPEPQRLGIIPPVVRPGVRWPAAIRNDAIRLEVSGTESESLNVFGAVAGILPLAASGRNGVGVGKLQCVKENDQTLLSWRAPGSDLFGSSVRIESNEQDVIAEDGRDESKYIRARAFTSYIQDGLVDGDIELFDIFNTGVVDDDVTSGEASAGNINTYTATIINDSPLAVRGVTVWISRGDAIGFEISDDGIAYGSPSYEGHADALTFAAIEPDASETIYMKRTISASAASDTDVLHVLRVAWTGY